MTKMTNRQWLLEQMQNMSDEEFGKAIIFSCAKWGTKYGNCRSADCTTCRTEWLNEEHKEIPKLSDAERVILENIDKGKDYRWIARYSAGVLCLCTDKPYKGRAYWEMKSGACISFLMFNHLFQFIKWEDEEPYNIAELLKGESNVG